MNQSAKDAARAHADFQRSAADTSRALLNTQGPIDQDFPRIPARDGSTDHLVKIEALLIQLINEQRETNVLLKRRER